MKIDLSKAIEVLQACGYECKEIESLRQQLADSQKQRVMLRNDLTSIAYQDPINLMCDPQWSSRIAKVALAATADLDGLILCEKGPVAWMVKINPGMTAFYSTFENIPEVAIPLYSPKGLPK